MPRFIPARTNLGGQDTQRPSSNWTGWGQWLALITMSVDHVTRYLMPDSWDVGWASSSIGRIAFPLFAAMVAWHGLFDTRDPLRYARRILVIGLLAQLPYMTMPRYGFQLNICFTLALGLCWGTLLHELARHSLFAVNTGGNAWGKAIKGWLTVAASLIVWWLIGPWVEYGHRGLLLIPFFMLALQTLNQPADGLIERLGRVAATLSVLLVVGLLNNSEMAKSFAVATCLLVLLLAADGARRVPVVAVKMPRKLWLAWYPGHFAAIAVLLHWPG